MAVFVSNHAVSSAAGGEEGEIRKRKRKRRRRRGRRRALQNLKLIPPTLRRQDWGATDLTKSNRDKGGGRCLFNRITQRDSKLSLAVAGGVVGDGGRVQGRRLKIEDARVRDRVVPAP